MSTVLSITSPLPQQSWIKTQNNFSCYAWCTEASQTDHEMRLLQLTRLQHKWLLNNVLLNINVCSYSTSNFSVPRKQRTWKTCLHQILLKTDKKCYGNFCNVASSFEQQTVGRMKIFMQFPRILKWWDTCRRCWTSMNLENGW